jgi:hypothetical protein
MKGPFTAHVTTPGPEPRAGERGARESLVAVNEVQWPQGPPAKLHQPWRTLVAVVELILAGAAVWFAFPCWQHGVKTVTLTLTDGSVLTSTRYLGNWMAGAIGLALLAAILLVDAIRELLLAFRTRITQPT